MSQLKKLKKLKDKSEHLDHKKKELDIILKETEKEENMLLKKSDDYKKLIEERLLFSYSKIRDNVKNGLAIVPVERGAAGDHISLFHLKFKWKLHPEKRLLLMNTVVEY